MKAVYVHIPFCEVKCGYCDFFSIPRGWEDFELQKEYTEALIREIETRVGERQGEPLRSIFFGGGTPSLLDPSLLEKIIGTLRKYFVWDEKTEFTLESNPKTVSLEKLKNFRSLGVNRLSIGVQSFQENFLKKLGRIHSGEEAIQTVRDAREAGFENINVDLIFSLPDQSLEDSQKDLRQAVSLETEHISAYSLTIEPNTAFATLHRQGKLVLPTDDESLQFFQKTRRFLEGSGFRPYEISNFARKGRECVHNQNYWNYGEYWGFGTAAASFVKNGSILRHAQDVRPNVFGQRSTNTRNLKKYLEGEWSDFSEEIEISKAMGEYGMLTLRMPEGVRGDHFQTEFGVSFDSVYAHELAQGIQKGWLEMYEQGWRLTEEGVLFADEVAMLFL